MQTFVIKFFRGINSAEYFVKDLVTGLNFTHNLVYPWAWYMAVGTGSAYTATVGVVNGFFVFLKNILFHFMAGDTEIEGIGCFHCGIEAAPENDADNHKKQCCTK